MRRTTPRDLAVPLLVLAVLAYGVTRLTYGSIPPLQYFWAVPLGFLAAAEYALARRVRAAVRHDPAAKPMPALAVARAAALGTSSALVGAGLVGAAAGFAVRLAPDAGRISAAGRDVRVLLVLIAVSLALVAAGLVLERSGIDPGSARRGGDPGGRPA